MTDSLSSQRRSFTVDLPASTTRCRPSAVSSNCRTSSCRSFRWPSPSRSCSSTRKSSGTRKRWSRKSGNNTKLVYFYFCPSRHSSLCTCSNSSFCLFVFYLFVFYLFVFYLFVFYLFVFYLFVFYLFVFKAVSFYILLSVHLLVRLLCNRCLVFVCVSVCPSFSVCL